MALLERIALCAMAVCLLALPRPAGPKAGGTAAMPVAQSQSDPQQPKPDPARSRTFTGTVVRQGQQYLLRAISGSSYLLDPPDRVKRFEGKAVRVTGRLDDDARLLHVDSIQPG
jgi:hypothetical protein